MTWVDGTPPSGDRPHPAGQGLPRGTTRGRDRGPPEAGVASRPTSTASRALRCVTEPAPSAARTPPRAALGARGARLTHPIEPLRSRRDSQIAASFQRRARCASLGPTIASKEEASAPQIPNCAAIASTIAALRASIVGARRADCRSALADRRNRHVDRAATCDKRLARRADCPQSWLLRPRSTWVPRRSLR